MNTSSKNKIEPFVVKDCSLITLSTGQRAINLRELCERIAHCSLESIDYHFFATKLRPAFDDPEYPNDFAAWVSYVLHDRSLAERLGMINPFEYQDSEGLRQETLNVVEDHLSLTQHIPWTTPEHEFIFLRSQMALFETGRRISRPEDFATLAPHLSTGSVYYHFVEARRRIDDSRDDFSVWLDAFGDGYANLKEALSRVDYYFCSLSELKDRISLVFQNAFGKKEGIVSR
ncbi:MAG: hypothetical protein IIB00_05530 [candidate division Zixibacteria bacterium]|nr:hypothetical protein [candidate division Zixibacteria bacterium]